MRLAGRLTLLVAAGAVAVAGVGYATGFEWEAWQHIGQPRNVLDVGGEQVRIPLPEGDPERLANPVAVVTDGAYAFMFEEPGQEPTRYDPCRPLGWVLNPDGMPEGGEALVTAAIDEVARAAGLVFEHQGTTTEVASFDRALFQDQYGEGFAPIIVGWSDEQATPDLAGSVTGLGGSSSVTGAFGEQRYLAAGVVILDHADISELMTTTRGQALASAVVMHEVAHVVGLAHIDDPTELMYEENSTLVSWGPGDRAGLAIAGSGPCQQ